MGAPSGALFFAYPRGGATQPGITWGGCAAYIEPSGGAPCLETHRGEAYHRLGMAGSGYFRGTGHRTDDSAAVGAVLRGRFSPD
jgi:hypothetical protein